MRRFPATKVVDKEWQVLKEKKVGLTLWNRKTIPPDSWVPLEAEDGANRRDILCCTGTS